MDLDRTGRMPGPQHGSMDACLHDNNQIALEPGEELIWSGRPDPLRLAKTRIPSALAGIALLVLLPFLHVPDAVAALGSPSSSFTVSRPFSAGLLLLALYLVLSPLRGYRAGLRTIYAVTDQRLLSVHTAATGKQTWSTRFRFVDAAILRLHDDGTGDIIVRPNAFADWSDGGVSGLDRFRCVADASAVYELVLASITKFRTASTGEAVQDYLDLLIQGKGRLDERHRTCGKG